MRERGLAAPVAEVRDGTLLAYTSRTVIREGPALFPNGFDPHGFIFGADRIQEGPFYLVRNPLQVLTAYQNGVENVVAFLTDGISEQQLGAHGRKKRERVELYLTRFQCEPIPRAAVRLVSQAMGHAKSGQRPMIRDVLKSTCRLAREAAFSMYCPFPSPMVSVGDVGTCVGQALVHKRLSSVQGRPCLPWRSQATEVVRGTRHGDTKMRNSDDPALRDYDDCIASALRIEAGPSLDRPWRLYSPPCGWCRVSATMIRAVRALFAAFDHPD